MNCYNPNCPCKTTSFEERNGTVQIISSPQFVYFEVDGERLGFRTDDYSLLYNSTLTGSITIEKHAEGFKVTSGTTGTIDFFARTNKSY